MNYKLEQLMEYGIYKKICDCFFSLSKNEEMANRFKQILYDGKVNNYIFSSKISNKDNPLIEIRRRVSLAYLFLTNPDTFDFLVNNNINIFHGTNANTLPSILKYGINSVNKLNEKGIPVLTGESWSRVDGKRDYISFTDVLDIARDYSFLNGVNQENQLSFDIVFGMSVSEVKNLRVVNVYSDVTEIGIDDCVPMDSIKCILVPSDKVGFVKKIVNNKDIVVLGMDYYDKKFYYIDDCGMIDIIRENFEKLLSGFEDSSKNKFAVLECEELAKSCSLLGIRKLLYNVKDIFFGNKREMKNERKI